MRRCCYDSPNARAEISKSGKSGAEANIGESNGVIAPERLEGAEVMAFRIIPSVVEVFESLFLCACG